MKLGFFVLLSAGLLVDSQCAWAGSDTARTKGGGALPLVTMDAAQRAGLSARQTNEAGKLYTAKCMRCHKSYEPTQYSQEDWDMWMRKMSKKAHLGSEQRDLLGRYLSAYRAGPTGRPANRCSQADSR